MSGSEELLGIAVEHATAHVPRARPGQSVGDVRDEIVGNSFASAVDIVVLDGERLVGAASTEAVLAADWGTRIEAVMDPAPRRWHPGPTRRSRHG